MDKENLVELLNNSFAEQYEKRGLLTAPHTATDLIAHGVTVQECCHKAESVISQTGLMCTACYSDIDRDSVFCKYCGARVVPQPKKGE